MGISSKLAESAGIGLTKLGSLELVSFRDAEKFVELARQQGLLVVGIEGLRVVDGRTVPDVDAIADFEGRDYDGSFPDADACKFIREVGEEGVLFDFSFRTKGL